ncbi:patatin 2, partial [Olea europaea subsp. europaea]
SLFGWVGRPLTFLFGPKYDGEYLHKTIREILGQTRLHDTLTNVVIPTFDIKNMHPRVFSTYQSHRHWMLDYQICIGTSASPTYLPSYYFKNQYKQSDVWEFNLIDGAVAANNPEDTLNGTATSVDGAAKGNLNKLVEIGQSLLKKPVSRVNLDSGLFEPIGNCGTNEDALKMFAKLLSEEKRFREAKSPFSKKTST